MAAYGHLALIAADHNDWQTCDVNVKTAFDLIAESELQEYWMGSFAHLAMGRWPGKQRKTSEAQAELTRAVTLARRGVGVVGLAYVLITVAEARRELGDRRSAVELVREARELSADAPDPGTVVPRLLDKAERSLRLVSEPHGSGLVIVEELPSARRRSSASCQRVSQRGRSARSSASRATRSRRTARTSTGSSARPAGAKRSRAAANLACSDLNQQVAHPG